MTLAGMSPLRFALLAGGVSAVVVALYLLKLRRPKVVVPFADLWQTVLAEEGRRTLFERLRDVGSLILQLALALLLVWALADPRPASPARPSSRAVLVLDASASMMARTRAGVAAFEAARADAASRAASLAPGGQVAVVSAGTTPELATGFTDDPSRLAAVLKRIRPAPVAADLASSLRYARMLLTGAENPKVIVFTDRPLASAEKEALGKLRAELCGVGRPLPNVGIARFAVRRLPASPMDIEGLVSVVATEPARAKLQLRIEEVTGEPRLVELLPVDIGSTTRSFRIASADAMRLRARLVLADGKPWRDALAVDDEAFACLSPVRRIRALVVGRERPDFFLAQAFSANPLVEGRWMTIGDYNASPGAAVCDVVVFDGALPARGPKCPALFLNPPASAEGPLQVLEDLPLPRLGNALRSHPILRGLALADVTLESASVVDPAPGDLALVRAARPPHTPLVFLRPVEGNWWLVVGFDLAATELPLRVDFPLFCANAIKFLSGGVAEPDRFVACGRDVVVEVPPGALSARLTSPDGTELELPAVDSRGAFVPDRTGFYTVTAGARRWDLGASLTSASESLLAGESAPERRKYSSAVPSLSARRLWALLVFAALAGLAVEWLTYNRRLTS